MAKADYQSVNESKTIWAKVPGVGGVADQMNRGTSNLIMPYKGTYKILRMKKFTLKKLEQGWSDILKGKYISELITVEGSG